jgi:soluble lytic murein transglycosylase
MIYQLTKKLFFLKKQLLISALFLCAALLTSLQASSNQFIKNNENLEEQRKIFSSLQNEYKLGKINPKDYKQQLAEYPLFPYIEYYYLLNKIGTESLENYADFFTKNESLASSSYLRKQLLLFLGDNKEWHNFKLFYKDKEYFFSDNDTIDIQCYYIQSQLADNIQENENIIDTEQAKEPISLSTEHIKSIESIYLTGNSLPGSCDPIIEKLESQGLLNNQLKLKRILLALKDDNYGLASFISKSLNEDDLTEDELSGRELTQYQFFDSLKDKPTQLKNIDTQTSENEIQDTEFTRFAITFALKQILLEDPPLAFVLWKEQKKIFSFTKEEIAEFTESCATHLYIYDSEHTETWLELANPQHNNSDLNQKSLVLHIKNHEWAAIISMYDRLSPSEKNESIWQYWYARSYIEYDKSTYIHPNAFRILDQLSRKRDYYGFLASFHLNNAPVFSRHSFPMKEQALIDISALPGIIRAHEFYILKDRVNASREWLFARKDFTPEQRGSAAVLAYQWGWLEQTIITASKSNQFNNISLRFPLGYSEQVNYYASKYSIPNEWVFAVIRQESAYGLEAESVVGALGLMQIMPSTAKVLAKENKIRRFKIEELFTPERNIQLGTYYLAQLRKKYDGNMLLASAAYNAGPSRVNSWLRNSPDMDIEMWVETIPYKETRNYVKNILTYQIIYQQELGREINSERLFLPLKTQ